MKLLIQDCPFFVDYFFPFGNFSVFNEYGNFVSFSIPLFGGWLVLGKKTPYISIGLQTFIEEWLEFQLREPDWSIQIGDDPRYITVLLVLTNMNQIFRLLYRNGVWLSAVVADEIGNLGLGALRAYERLARVSLEMGEPRFALYPKFHLLMHVFYWLVWRAARCQFIESPMTDNCQMCEGFIGSVARLSRRVSPKACVERTIAIYLISLWKHWTDRE